MSFHLPRKLVFGPPNVSQQNEIGGCTERSILYQYFFKVIFREPVFVGRRYSNAAISPSHQSIARMRHKPSMSYMEFPQSMILSTAPHE